MDLSWMKDFQGVIGALTGAVVGFCFARVGSRFDRQINQKKSNEMYYKHYMIYKDNVHKLINELHLFVHNRDRTAATLARIHRNADYLKQEFQAFPLEVIPKDIFVIHREFMSILISFQFATIMEEEFDGATVFGYQYKLQEFEDDYKRLLEIIEEIESHVEIY